MINLVKVRRQRKALELVCELLKVDDKMLDDFIINGFKEEPQLNVFDTVEEISKCKNIEDLEVYKSDERKTVINAYNKKLKELQ